VYYSFDLEHDQDYREEVEMGKMVYNSHYIRISNSSSIDVPNDVLHFSFLSNATQMCKYHCQAFVLFQECKEEIMITSLTPDPHFMTKQYNTFITFLIASSLK